VVNKVMRPPYDSTSGGRPVAPCGALCHRESPPVVQPPEKADHCLFLDGFSLDGSARRTPLPLSTVYKKARLREVPCVKVGRALRFDVQALERFIEQHTIETID
jgi:excisionase family DNA binding protein